MMRTSITLIRNLALIVVTVGMLTAYPSAAQLAADTPEYKCYASMVDETPRIFYFYDQGTLPDRFSDDANFAAAKIPASIRQHIVRIDECVLRNLTFTDPAAVELEARLPQ